jgi:hypothetical protein
MKANTLADTVLVNRAAELAVLRARRPTSEPLKPSVRPLLVSKNWRVVFKCQD